MKGKVVEQLESKAKTLNVDIQVGDGLSSISPPLDDENYTIRTDSGKIFKAKSIILATEGPTTTNLLSSLPGFESIKSMPEQVQRAVGCIYYGFKSPLPVTEPILILNGANRTPVTTYPVNNVCFPSTVTGGYAPEGHNLCSVTILEPAMNAFEGCDEDLDIAVRHQLKEWFPNHAMDIESHWEMKGIYKMENAQPGQLSGPAPANVNGGRDCSSYRGFTLPKGLFLCGDHMSTATLNGAFESGVNAAMKTSYFLQSAE